MPGMVRLKQLKDVELWYDSLAAITLRVYTDMTGDTTQGTLALAATLTLPLTSGRATYTAPLDNIYCTQIQFVASSSSRVILFGGILRVLDIGCYFLGQNGEVWDSTVMSIGMAA
jgi:hypothetical protein